MIGVPMKLVHPRPANRCGVTTTPLVLVLLLVLAAACTGLWMLQRSVSSFHRDTLEVRRADQLARSAIAEAMQVVRGRANEPRPAPEESPASVLDGFFRGLRPPMSTDRPPKLTATQELPTPFTTALAAEDEFHVGPVKLSCPALKFDGSHLNGVLEAIVELRGGHGPRPISRRLTERRLFYGLADAVGTSTVTPSPALFWTIHLIATPLGRKHETLE